MQKTLSLSILLMLLAGWSCTQEGDATTVVTTEEVIFVSGDKVRVLGRLIADQPVSTSDHGFQISSNQNFSSPIIESRQAFVFYYFLTFLAFNNSLLKPDP